MNTRSARRSDHFLLTPDTFVRAPLPGMTKATAIVHVSPAAGAKFTQYSVEFDASGALGPTPFQRFVYALEGEVKVDGHPAQYAYIPAGCEATVTGVGRAAVVEKLYIPLAGTNPPALFLGDERDVPGAPLGGDPDLICRTLIPAEPAFDFAVNTMQFQPGVALSQVESHVMEHGLLMLEGAGIYRLSESWYSVEAGDFIYMAPWCTQWFAAVGKVPAKYLIYKDWNR